MCGQYIYVPDAAPTVEAVHSGCMNADALCNLPVPSAHTNKHISLLQRPFFQDKRSASLLNQLPM